MTQENFTIYTRNGSVLKYKIVIKQNNSTIRALERYLSALMPHLFHL